MSASDTPDPAASALDRISAELRAFGASDEDMHRLLAAVDAALTGTGTLDAESARFGKIADDADPGSAVEVAALAASQAYDRSARILREAITAALTENDSAPAGAVREDGGP